MSCFNATDDEWDVAEQKVTINDWLSILTRAGYDVVGVNAYTSRTDLGEEKWNTNYPMQHNNWHFRHCDPKRKAPEIVLCTYSVHASSDYTIYGTKITGKTASRLRGFATIGTKEQEAGNFTEFKKWLEETFGHKYWR